MAEGPTVALIGALDTKGEEYAYLRELLLRHGVDALVIDTGVLGEPRTRAEVTREQVASESGHELQQLRTDADRNAGMEAMGSGATAIVRRLYDEGAVQGLLAVGGSNAAYITSMVCATLPIGFPKLLVSTMAASDTRAYVGQTDLTMMYPVVDINGLNGISKPILTNAAAAIAAMASVVRAPDTDDSAVVAISMFGVTTTCGLALREQLDTDGYEALTFHMTGVGGLSMEALIRSGHIQAVADMTTTELADDLAGGVCTAGPDRLTAAGEMGIPQVVSLGALDMVNFGAMSTIPEKYAGRLFHQHNPEVTLMRTNAEECAELGRRIAAKLNAATGPTALIVPTKGVSQISVEGAPFYDPVADAALIDAVTADLQDHVVVHLLETDINDPIVAATAASIINDWLEASNT